MGCLDFGPTRLLLLNRSSGAEALLILKEEGHFFRSSGAVLAKPLFPGFMIAYGLSKTNHAF
jgi:hypothetical protein